VAPTGAAERTYLFDTVIKPLEKFSLAQEGALSDAENKRAAIVTLVKDHEAAQAALTKALKPKPWWRVW
jgi:hypothetical protein